MGLRALRRSRRQQNQLMVGILSVAMTLKFICTQMEYRQRGKATRPNRAGAAQVYKMSDIRGVISGGGRAAVNRIWTVLIFFFRVNFQAAAVSFAARGVGSL